MANKVAKPEVGHQLDSDTLLLYKMGDTEVGQEEIDLIDVVGNNPLAAQFAANDVSITWGPGKKNNRDKFARFYTGIAGDHHRSAAVLGAGNLLRQHMVEDGGEYTVEVLARADTSAAGFISLTGIFGGAGETAPDDGVLRIRLDPSLGTVNGFWERTGANQSWDATTGAPYFVAGEWFVLHIVHTDRSATEFDVAVYMSKVGDLANLRQSFGTGDFTEGDGDKPNTNSATNGHIYIGNSSANSNVWNGAIGSVRYVNKAMSALEISTAADELLTTGDVTDGLTALGHWRMNERPTMVDETDFGFHLNGVASNTFPEGSRGFDIVGTEGIARRAEDAVMHHNNDTINFETTHGRRLIEFFTDDIDAIPEYTIEAWLMLPARALSGGTYRLLGWGPGGGGSDDNSLFRHTLTTSFETAFFAEFGPGTNVAQTPANTQIINTAPDTTDGSGRIHWAIRTLDVGSVFTIEHYINGILEATHTIPTTPNGGEGASGHGFRIGDWDGFIQDVRVSKVARTPAEILASAQNCGQDTTAPTFVLNSPANGSQLARGTVIDFTLTDLVPGIAITGVWVKYKFDSHRMLVYDGDSFQFPFSLFSKVTDVNSDSTQLNFTVRPVGGWLGEIEQLQVRVGDGDGNIDLGVSDGIVFLAP